MKKIKEIGKMLVPSTVVRAKLSNLYESYLVASSSLRYHEALMKVKKKKRIKVVFLVLHSSIWKCDYLYKMMELDENFQPLVVICPYIKSDDELMSKEMEEAYNLFFQKKYNVIKTYNAETGTWLDIKKEVNPDIVFFTNPHELSRKEYNITNFLDKLTCYIPYTFQVTYSYSLQYDQLFHNLVWKAFYQTPIHKELAHTYAKNKGINVFVSGYPGIDVFRDKSYLAVDKWKIMDHKVKRIIWAPHHSINDDRLSFSNFLKYYNVMLDIAEKYSDRIQIAFKPHPILKPKLILDEQWGKEKTDEYYLKWDNMTNGQLEESDYVDLFLTSDAMIHDSDSFMIEYLAVNKPVLYTVHDDKVTDRFNAFGKMAYEHHYKAHYEEDIIDFIESIVLNEHDPLSDSREAFLKNWVNLKKNCSASENIFNEIKRELKINSNT